MRRKPGPRKKPGERYPSGDLKPVIPPAIWGRIQSVLNVSNDQRFNSELGRLWLYGELTDTQAAGGRVIAHIYRNGDSEKEGKARRHATAAATDVDPHASRRDRKALDELLSEYPPKLSEAVIELCVFNRTVDWKLRPQIRQLLDDVARWWWRDARRRGADGSSKLARRSIRPWIQPLDRADKRRRRTANIQASEGRELTRDRDPDIEATKEVIASLRPDLDAEAKARAIQMYVAFRDREKFRQEKNDHRGRIPNDK
jgi:hypothetical protein